MKKGQLLARIDPTLAQQAVADAQANLEKAQAQAMLASRDYKRNRELTDEGLVAVSAFEQTRAGAQVANASVKSARVALQRAQQNLGYTNIYAPIDGVVVARNVDAGQTVAASLSAPELFKIANDLRFKPESSGARLRRASSTLYYLNAQGKLASLPVRTGITDGTETEIRGREIREGMTVITGSNAPAAQNASTSTAGGPFQSNNQQQQQPRRGGAPGGF